MVIVTGIENEIGNGNGNERGSATGTETVTGNGTETETGTATTDIGTSDVVTTATTGGMTDDDHAPGNVVTETVLSPLPVHHLQMKASPKHHRWRTRS